MLAAVDWIGAQNFADANHAAVAGRSFGEIETVFTAEPSSHTYAAGDFA